VARGATATLLGLVATGAAASGELKPETVKAWTSYLQTVDARTKARFEGKRSFLWIAEDGKRRAAVQNGEIVVGSPAAANLHSVDNGLIHDWIGGMFIPGASIDDALAIVRDHNRYHEIFRPTVTASKDVGESGDHQTFWMQWSHKVLFLTAALEGEFESRQFKIDSARWYSVAFSTSVQEIVGYGTDSERKLASDQGPGFVWRLYGVTRYQQQDGGIYMEQEALALSRDIPFSMRWFVKPAIDSMSRKSIARALEQTREAVLSLMTRSGPGPTGSANDARLGPR
jgi:hypothetical protein